MAILLNLMIVLAIVGMPLLFLAAFIYFFSLYRKLKKESAVDNVSRNNKRYLLLSFFLGVLFFVLAVLSAYYLFLIFSGNILM